MFSSLSSRGSRRVRAAFVGILVGILSLGAAPAIAATESPTSSPTSVGSGSISGTVTDGSGVGVAGAEVSVVGADDGATAKATTGSQGGYTVPDLLPGSYYVSIAAEKADPVFWPDAATLGDARTVEVSEAAAVTGIDIVVAGPTAASPAPSAGEGGIDGPSSGEVTEPSTTTAVTTATSAETYTVTVHVTADDGASVANASVALAGTTYVSGRTDATGSVSLPNVPAGSYGVYVYPPTGDLAGQTTRVDVAGDSTIEVVLHKPATLRGHLTSTSADVIDIRLLRADDLEAVRSWRVGAGAFTLDRVPPGQYLLDAEPVSDTEAPTLYPGVSDPHDATVITIGSGAAVDGIDFSLNQGHSITGTVSGRPGSYSQVNATSRPIMWNGRSVYLWWRQGYDSVDTEGYYVMSGLADGDYTVSASAYGPNPGEPEWLDVYYQGYYDGAVTLEDANPVAVRGTDVHGIDITLLGHGTASGEVGADAETVPLKNTLITAYRWNGATWDETLSVSGWGRYSLGLRMSDASYGLPEGTYTVGFSDPDPVFGDDGVDYPYCPQYWDNHDTLGAADRFSVTAGKNTSGIDATLRLKSSGCATEVITPGAPVIEGTPRVGGSVTANPGTWGPQPVQLAYQWRADGVAIDGATGTTFAPTAAQIGTKLSVAVTGSRPGYDSVTVVSPPSAVVAAALIVPGTPAVDGTPIAGSVLTAKPGTWTPSDVTLAYQWLAGGAVVPGATGSTFVPGDDEVGKDIAVTVTGSKPGYTTVSATSAAVGPVVAAPLRDLEVGTPRIDGEARVGGELVASPGTWGPQPVDLSYSWSVGGVVVVGADGPRFTPGPDAVDKIVTVSVRGSKSGYRPATVTASTGPVARGVITGGSASITGDPRVGATLTAQSSGWTPAGVTLAYQWYSDGTAVAGATAATFEPGADLVGAIVQVEVTASFAGYTDATVRAQPVGPIAPGLLQAGNPSLSGPALSGVPVVVDPGVWGPAPVELAYQWLLDGQPIGGATDASYSPTTIDVGGHLTVAVTGAKPGYTSVTTIVDAGRISASIALDVSSALAGGAIVVTGTGYEPGETVRVELHSTVAQLGTAVADAAGNFRLPTVLPLSVISGEHTVYGIGETSGRQATAPITVGTPASQGGGTSSAPGAAPRTLAATGSTVPIMLTGLGILLAVGGALLLRRPVRRRP